MKDFKIIIDSCADIPEDIRKEYDITTISFYLSLDGKEYFKQENITNEEFCNRIVQNPDLFPKTSLPSIQDFIDVFKKTLEQNLDILYISMSSKLSGAFQASITAIETLKESYKDANIVAIDSKSASFGAGILAILAGRMKNSNMSISEIKEAIEKLRDNVKIFVTVDSLAYLQKGGRIGRVSAVAGNLLKIKPIISVRDGELFSFTKVRGRQTALHRIADITAEIIGKHTDDYICSILHLGAYKEAEELKNRLEQNYNIHVEFDPIMVGAVIGSHIGPTTVGVVCIKKSIT
jgi:DegV family protein with EDD domain